MLAFIRHNLRWIAGGFLLTYLSSFGQTFFVSASVAEWQATFDLSHGEFGRLYMFATLGSALCLPFIGRAVDFMPQSRVITLVVPVLAAATVIAAYAPNVVVLTGAIFLLRLLGQGMMTHIALTATGRWFVAKRGRAVSLVVLGHQGGEATLPLAFAAIAVPFGFQAGWIASAAVLLLLGLPLAAWAYSVPRVPHRQDGTPEVAREMTRDWTRTEVIRDPLFWVLLTGVLAPPFIGTTIFYHQDYLTALRAWPPQLFSMSLTVMATTTVVCALINGVLIDRFGAKVVLPFFLLPLGASCLVLGLGNSAAVLFVAMILLGVSYGISSTLFGALWPEIYGLAHLGSIRSVTVSAVVLATAIGPGLTGTLIDLNVALPAQFVALGVYCLVAALAMTFASLRLRRRF